MRVTRFPEAKDTIVKRLVTTKDELCGEIEDWQSVGTIQAEIWPLQGNKARSEMGVTEKSTHKAFASGPGVFESNTRLVDLAGKTYLVGYTEDWGTHGVAVLELLKGVGDGG